MKKVILTFWVIISLLGISSASVFWAGETDRAAFGFETILTESEAELVHSIIESLPWIEEGAQNGKGKYLYVFFYPECPASQRFYDVSRAYLDQINIRWIPITDETNLGIYETRTSKALYDAFKKGVIPVVENRSLAETVLKMTITAFIYLDDIGVLSPEGNAYFPTVFYGGKDRLSIVINPMNLDVLVDSIPESVPSQESFVVKYAGINPNIQPLEVEGLYQVTQATEFYLFPQDDGVYLGELDSSMPALEVLGITKNGFVAVDLTGQGHVIYLKDDEPMIVPISGRVNQLF